jgi:hypothetical protein
MGISFQYGGGDEESVNLTDTQAKQELMAFLNCLSDSGKKQWMAKMKKQDITYPFEERHYNFVTKRFMERS